jgi:hypothetical protein
MAVDKYDNANNYRGFPYLTGTSVAMSTFVPGTTVDTPTDGGTGGGGGTGTGGEFDMVEFEGGTG